MNCYLLAEEIDTQSYTANVKSLIFLGIFVLVAMAAFIFIRMLGSLVIIFGRRRTVLMILAGYLAGMLARYFISLEAGPEGVEQRVVGFIIPGLIAVWLDRRGVVESLCSLITASVVVRLLLIIMFGARLAV